jgi:hypothetical protein
MWLGVPFGRWPEGRRRNPAGERSWLTTLLGRPFARSSKPLETRAGASGYILKGAEQAQVVEAIHAVSRGEAILGPGVGSPAYE